MKRIADFIVEKYRWVMIIFVILTIIAAICSTQVTINTDLTKYLPDDSDMKIGMELMEEEFGETTSDNTEIRIMFTDLSQSEKQKMVDRLEKIPHIDSVTYDSESEEYNKDRYTKYDITVAGSYGSKAESAVETALETKFQNYEMTYVVDDTAAKSISKSILLLALGILIIILLIMSESWFEPILFIITIIMAIIMNLGTNLILGTVSNTTSSLGPILQLVLSMDYSIILMNRYHQELEVTEDRKGAMKTAWMHAFSSISSSSFTTVVGLLALVFMSFKLGRDVGIVLAKGVLISVFSVLTFLPGITMIATPLIQKTRKKAPIIPTDGLANFSYKFRKIITPAFILLFIGAYFFQQNTELTYSMDSEDEISKIFPKSQTVVMMYENDDEDGITTLEEELEDRDNVTSVTGYGNMLGKKNTVSEMKEHITNLGSVESEFIDSLDESLLGMLYYDYFTHGKLHPMTASDFIRFLADDVVNGKVFGDQFDDKVKENIADLKKYADADQLTKPMSAKELAKFMNLEEDSCKQLFLLYYMENGGVQTGKMTVQQFFDFIVNDLAKDKTYGSLISKEQINSVQSMMKYTNAHNMTTGKTYKEMAKLMGMDASTMQMMYVYYYADKSDYNPGKMTLPDLVSFLKKDIAKNKTFSSQFDSDTLAKMELLSNFTDPSLFQSQMNASQLAKLFGIEEKIVNTIMISYTNNLSEKNTNVDKKVTMSPQQFVTIVLKSDYAASLDDSMISTLNLLNTVMKDSTSGTLYNYKKAASLFGMDSSTMKMLYTYRSSGNSNWKISAQTLLNYIVNHRSTFRSALGKSTFSNVQTLQKIVNSSISGTKYSSSGMSNIIGLDESMTRKLYLLNTFKNGDISGWKMSVQKFVSFLSDNMKSNEEIAARFDKDTVDTIEKSNTLIQAIVSGKKYTPQELYQIINGFSKDLDKNKVKLIYLYHDSLQYSKKNWKLNLLELVDFLVDDVSKDVKFETVLDDEMRDSLVELQSTLHDAADTLRGENYSRVLLKVKDLDDMDNIRAFYNYLTEKLDDRAQGNYYLIGDSAMSYEMSKSFDSELAFITLLTAIAIFVIVALTFRNLVLPAILVLIVQCGVYIAVSVVGIQGLSLYYLALLMVECILMGSTIDYGILFTTYYLDCREIMDIKNSLKTAYRGSIHTIMTSGSILVIVTGVLSNYFPDPSVSEICRNISIGAFSAAMLILFILPGVLAAMDRFIIRRKK